MGPGVSPLLRKACCGGGLAALPAPVWALEQPAQGVRLAARAPPDKGCLVAQAHAPPAAPRGSFQPVKPWLIALLILALPRLRAECEGAIYA